MKAAYADGTAPGYGEIILTEAIFPSGPWQLAIQRGSDQFYAAGDGKWIPEASFFPADGEAFSDGSLHLKIGPNVVDSLDQQESYLVTLKGDGESQKGRLRITAITYTPGGSGDYTARREPRATPPEPPAHPPSPSPTPEEGLELPPPAPPVRSSRRLWRFILIGVLIAGCAAWYALDPRKSSEPAREESPPSAQSAQQGKSQAAAPQLSAEEEVRQFFKQGRNSPLQAMELAARLSRKTPHDQDAVYRLWYFAAENGEPSAYVHYGQALDPSQPQFGSIEKDAVEAWHIYEKVRETDPARANQLLENLRQWLQTESAKGSVQARDWLLRVDQPR